MKGQVFLYIVSQLTEKVPELQKVDLNRGQLDDGGPVAHPYPYALVSFKETTYKEEGQGLQYGSSIIQISIAQEDNKLDNQNGPSDETLAVMLDLPHKIYLALQDEDANINGFSAFTRISDGPTRVNKTLIIDEIQFVTVIYDDVKRTEYELNRVGVPSADLEIN